PPSATYTLSLHDALPISPRCERPVVAPSASAHQAGRRPVSCPVDHLSSRLRPYFNRARPVSPRTPSTYIRKRQSAHLSRLTLQRSEEHTSELQSRENLVC